MLAIDHKNGFIGTLQVSRMQDGNPVTSCEISAAITGSRTAVCIAGASAIGTSTSGRSAYRGDLFKMIFTVYTAVKARVLPFVHSFSHYCLLAALFLVVVISSAGGLTWNGSDATTPIRLRIIVALRGCYDRHLSSAKNS